MQAIQKHTANQVTKFDFLNISEGLVKLFLINI